jgi:maltose O-acetyltransferase
MGILQIAREIKHRLSYPVQKGRKQGVVIGERVSIQFKVVLDHSHGCLIEIGDDVTLAPRVHILAHDASTKRHLNYTKIGKVKIGNRVFIGAGAIVLPGVFIGDDVVVGAGSVVTHDIPSATVVAGNPARVICSTQSFLDKRRKEMESYPCFGAEYTIEGGVTEAMKDEMNQAMKNRFGYIV